MKIAFTICSNNYLAQAKILGDSLLDKNPDYKFYIGLCDILNPEIDYSQFNRFEIIQLNEINIYNFEEIITKYDIVELNTSIKPSFFKYFINKHLELEKIIYFDPDIEIFNNFSDLETHFEHHDILITPHILNPIPLDNSSPAESLFLNFGLYNLGFIGFNAKSNETISLLNWWEERTLKIGYNRVCEGLFVDQLWINYVPLFFKNVKIIEDLGFNAAPWNLHERSDISLTNNEYIMQDGSKLIFFHFSSFNFKKPNELSKYYDRFNNLINSTIISLYDQYYKKLLTNNIEQLERIPCFYMKKDKLDKYYYFKKLIPPIFIDLKNKIYQSK